VEQEEEKQKEEKELGDEVEHHGEHHHRDLAGRRVIPPGASCLILSDCVLRLCLLSCQVTQTKSQKMRQLRVCILVNKMHVFCSSVLCELSPTSPPLSGPYSAPASTSLISGSDTPATAALALTSRPHVAIWRHSKLGSDWHVKGRHDGAW